LVKKSVFLALLPASWDFDAERLLYIINNACIILSCPVLNVNKQRRLDSDLGSQLTLSEPSSRPGLTDGLSASVRHRLDLDLLKPLIVDAEVVVCDHRGLIVQLGLGDI